MFYFLSQQIDEDSETDATLYKHAFADVKKKVEFGNCRSKHGLEAAMPLFRQITYKWSEYAINPIGDLMAGSIYSPRAAEVLRQLRGDFWLFEPIDIEGTPAFYVANSMVTDLNADLDIFFLKKLGYRTIVSERFKQAWETAGLLGAEFKPVPEDWINDNEVKTPGESHT